MTKGDDMGCLGNMTAVEKLMALAADWEDRSCGLYVHLREGSECRWGVNGFSRGSVSEILREIADRAREEQADLKMFAERVHGMLWADGWHDLDEIADRLEEELSELDRMCCHEPEEHDDVCCDGMVHPVDDEDYAAAMWVREHGGVEGLKARMLPDGIEWPRFEDGEQVRLGDEVQAHNIGQTSHVTSIVLSELGSYVYYRWCGKDDGAGVPGNRVKRPAPKVLDADGVEIRVGDTVYLLTGDWCDAFPCFGYHGGEELEVFSLHAAHVEGGIGCRDTRRPLGRCYPQPSQLTHRAPVLAADGRPLREGETVWYTPKNLGYPIECRVEKVNGDGSCELIDVAIPTNRPTVNPGKLTHERPDSWERLEEDCAMFASEYAEKHGLEKDGGGWGVPMRRDLVRRAKALAERGA